MERHDDEVKREHHAKLVASCIQRVFGDRGKLFRIHDDHHGYRSFCVDVTEPAHCYRIVHAECFALEDSWTDEDVERWATKAAQRIVHYTAGQDQAITIGLKAGSLALLGIASRLPSNRW